MLAWIIDGFAVWVVAPLTAAIGAFDNKELAFAIAFGILLVALVVGLLLHVRGHRRFRQPLRQLTQAIQAAREQHPGDAAARLEAVTAVFKRIAPRLDSLWQEYRDHLQPHPKGDGYINLLSPRAWFSLEALPGRGYEHWCATWSGVFLTIGLLFTFIGLSAALLAVSDISSADSSAMKKAIAGILNASSAKFITSIAGILAYIIFSLLTRYYHACQHAVATELADAIQHLTTPLTPEVLLYEQKQLAQEQLTQMQRFTDDLAVAIDGKLKERIADLDGMFNTHLGTLSGGITAQLEQIRTALPSATAQPIVTALEGLGAGVAQANQQAMREMLELFRTQMQQTGQSEINAVIERLGSVAEELGKVQGGMRGAGAAFGTDIQAAAQQLGLAAEQMRQGATQQSNELGQQLAQFGTSLGHITAALGETPEHINRALNETLSQLTTAVDALVDKLSQGGKIAGAGLGREVIHAGQAFDRQIVESSNKLTATVGHLDATLQQFSSRLTLVEASLQRLPAAVAEQVTSLAQAGSTFTNVGKTVQDTVAGLQVAAAPVANTAQALRQAAEQMQQSVQESAQRHEALKKLLETSLQGLQAAATAAERTFLTHEARFGQVDTALAATIDRLKTGVEDVTRDLGQVLGQYDEHLTGAMKSLKQGVDYLADAIDDRKQPPSPLHRS